VPSHWGKPSCNSSSIRLARATQFVQALGAAEATLYYTMGGPKALTQAKTHPLGDY